MRRIELIFMLGGAGERGGDEMQGVAGLGEGAGEKARETHMQGMFKTVVDLSRTVEGGMAVYPGDPAVRVEEVAHLERDGFAVARIEMNDHVGTHMETQYHMMAGRRLVDEPVSRFVGRAAVLDVRRGRVDEAESRSGGEAARGAGIGVEELGPWEAMVRRNRWVVLCTGYSGRTSAIDPEDPGRPVVEVEALQWLCERGMEVFGIDAFDFDSGSPYPGHRVLFERGVLIIEGLVGLEAVVGREVMMVALPMKVAGTGGGLCRVVALV